MTNKKSAKRAMLVSVLSLLLCVTMLIGTTFAWFTDSVTSNNNVIMTGDLDIALYREADGKKVEVDSNTELFDTVTLWEPGAVTYENLTVANLGTLALKYQITLNVTDANTVKDSDLDLTDVLKVAVVPNGVSGTRDEMLSAAETAGWTALATLSEKGELYPAGNEDGYADSTTYGVVIYWEPTENDNEYNLANGKETSDEADDLHITIGASLFATQLSYEEDAFGATYDASAPAVAWNGQVDTSWYNDTDTEFVIYTAEELAGFAQLVNAGNSFAGKTVKLGMNIDLGNKQWTPIGNSTNYFEGEFDGQGYTVSNMSIEANTPDADQYVGLFGGIQNAVIKNLTMKDASIDVLGKKVRAAAVVGIADSDKSTPQVLVLNFENITVDGCEINAEAASGSVLSGGVVGYCYPANMKNISVSDITINGKAENNEVRAAAIAGYVCGQNISNNGNTRMAFAADTFSVNDVVIEAEGYTVFAGGYAPYTYYGYIDLTDGTVDNLKITVDAHEAFVGGLVGYFWRSDEGHTVENVHITNIDFDVTTDYLGETRIGDMVGTSQSPNTKYTDCSVSGKIVERCSTDVVNYHAKVGGFVARTYEFGMQTYTNCVADVDVTGSNVAGGFVANHTSTVSYVNCEAKGDVTADIAGGFAGRLTNSSYTSAVTFDGCSASGKVTGTNVAGGIIGSTISYGWNEWGSDKWSTAYDNTVTIKNCKFTGTVTSGTEYCAGIVGEAKMADGVEIVIENVECSITPTLFP